MKRFIIVLALMLLCGVCPAWADLPVANQVTVLPLARDRVLISVESPKPVIMEVSRLHGFPALLLKGACISDALVTPDKQLSRAAFIRPVPYPVKIEQGPGGIALILESHTPVTLSVTTTDTGFVEEAARDLPLYPQWNVPVEATAESPAALMEKAYKAFEKNNPEAASEALETLFFSEPDPPESLYQLLGALYLYEGDWVRALALYGQGTHQYPESLGLRYSALLYQLHQNSKAAQVLSDMLITVDIPQEALAQAHYMLGSIYAEQHDYAKALPHLQLAAQTFSNNPDVLFNLAVGYEGTKQPALALETYQKALPLSQNGMANDIQAQINRLKNYHRTLPENPPS